MKHGAIFDMDGTLVDTEKLYRQAWLSVADEFGVERNLQLPAAISGTSFEVMPEVVHKFLPMVDAQKYVDRVLEVVREVSEKSPEVKSGVFEILEYFSAQKIPMAVASSSDAEVIEKILTKAGLKKYFLASVGGDQISNSKPAPDIFLKAAELIGVAAEDCYIFEDGINGIQAAAAAKGCAIFVIDCVEPSEEIRKICAGVYNNFHETLSAIKCGEV